MKLRASALILLAAVAGCSEAEQPANDAPRRVRTAEAVAKQSREACASRATYDALKSLAFRQALQIRRSKSKLLEQTYGNSVVRMEEPLVRRRDERLGVTVCTGRFILELPPGAVDAFDGDRRLVATIEYAAQPAADGSGLVYQMSGAEPIVYRLAAVALHEPPPPVVVTRAVPAPLPPPTYVSQRPADRCAGSRSRDEYLICSDVGLTRRAQRVEQEYARAMARADRRTRRALEASSGRFAAYRRGCPDAACIEEALEDRVEEIRDIARN